MKTAEVEGAKAITTIAPRELAAINETLSANAAAISVYQAAVEKKSNENQARQSLNSMQTSPSKIVVASDAGIKFICIENITTGMCDMVKSDVDTSKPDESIYNLADVTEQQAIDIRAFLFKFNDIRYDQQCVTQKMECSESDGCKLTVRCYKPR